MAITLNLLPQDQVVDKSTAKILKFSRTFSLILICAFIIFTVSTIALIIVNNSRLKKLFVTTEELKRDVAQLEVSEQQIILLKDRIKKIQTVGNTPSSVKNLTSIDTLLSQLPENTIVTELGLDSKKIDLSLRFKSNFEMSQFLTQLSESEVFKTAVMTSFGFSPNVGYLISLDLSGN